MKTLSRNLGSLLLVLTLPACVNLAPDYVRPASPAPATLTASAVKADGGNLDASRLAETDWQALITDARLREVIRLALEQNRDLRVAVANVEKARATYQVQIASDWPDLTASTGATRTHTPGTVNSSGKSTTSTTYKAQIGVSYELDLFGRIGNLDEAALQSFLQLDETRRNVRLTLIASVASAWLTLDADQRLLDLAQRTLQSREETLATQTRAHELGGASGLTLASAQSSREAARASVASYRSATEQARTALELLVGSALPDSLLPPVAANQSNAAQLLAVPAGLSSSALLRRPDIRAAEHTLLADNANIGAARAAFFPSISLTAAGGSSSTSLSNLFSAGSGAWSFAPSISLPIFDGGSNRATLDARKAQQQADIATYEKTIQTAFSEVANALSVRRYITEQIDAQRAQVAALIRSQDLATALYRQGSGSYLDVLDAQRSRFSAEQTLISLELAEQSNRITLYKALGGGTASE